VWAAVLELNAWRRARQDRPLVAYQALCRELAASGPGTFGELDTAGARSVLRRYSDAWFAAAAANIAARAGGGTTPAIVPAGVTHRRAGAHLPGVAPSRRDPRRRAHRRGARGSPGRHRPARASPDPSWRGSRSPRGEEPGISNFQACALR